MLPTTQEYKISLMIGQDSFRTLEGVEVIPNPNYPDEPWYSTGGLAIVFKLKLKDKLYALKCFYTEANERQERLGLIAAYLKQTPSPYFVDFTYLENELWVATDNHEGQGYPVVLMEWVEGKTLDNYLEQICTQNNTPALKNLYFQFCNLAWWLQQQPIAHGDIKHDNLIVTPDGKLKLIDYDGVFVPALRGRKANEMGSPCYQHPKRDAYFFDKNLDDFSLLVLQITLLALQHQPKLFTEHYNGDGIILKDTDYQNFAQSPIKTILWQLPEVKIPLLLSQLSGNLNNLNAIDLMPLLQDVAWINWLVGGQRNGKLNFERERLKEFILVQGGRDWRKWFIDYVSNNYPLNSELIETYKDIWHWRKKMSGNEFLPWSIELIEKYEDKLVWNGHSDDDLSKNKSLPWSIELIAKYETKWDWFGISGNESLPWSVELVQKFKDKLIWNILVENKSIPWSMELVKTFNKKLTWRNLSMFKFLPWSIELVEKHKVKWDWNELSNNKYLPWSIELIETCKNELNWENLSYNQSLPWSIELIERYKDSWKWGNLSNNISLPWSIELIEKYEDKWKWGRLDQRDWRSLSSNEGLPWSIELIAKYEKKWDWISLSENDSLPWSIELLEMYKENWEWGWYSHGQEHYFNRLGINSLKSLPWSIDLIERYEDKWEWTILSNNVYLPWSMELIEKFKDKWILEGSYDLQSNESLPWSLELIDKFKDKWIIGSSCNKSIYKKVLKPFLDDEFIDEIMNVINQKFKKKEITKRDIWMDEF